MKGKRIAIGVFTLLLAACATQREGPTPPPPTILPSALAPDRYLEEASSASLFILKASELAETRASSERVRAFARTARADHDGISAQLSFAGRRVNLLPSATLLPAHAAMLSALEASGSFDAAYTANVRRVLASDAALHAAFARSGSSPTLRPVAAMAAPIVQRELASARAL